MRAQNRGDVDTPVYPVAGLHRMWVGIAQSNREFEKVADIKPKGDVLLFIHP